MLKFEWDARKDASNRRKHGVRFDEAASIFGDPNALTFPDVHHSEIEDRSRTYGLSVSGRILVVIHTDRADTIRLISARKATKNEENIYKEG